MKNNFIQRVSTSAVFVIILIGSSLLHPISLFTLFAIIVLIGQLEFYRIVIKNKVKPQLIPGILFGLYLFASIFLAISGIVETKYLVLFIPFLLLINIIELYKGSKDPFSNVVFTVFGAIYLGIPFGLTGLFVFHPAFGVGYNSSVLIAFFLMIWASDSGAYITGSLIGKHKLFESISPKKTWEGFLGGALFAATAAFVISLFLKELPLYHWIIISILTTVFGTYGDLFESLLKRKANMKDSGNILPGHGGILDRFDSLLFAAPVVYLYLLFFTI